MRHSISVVNGNTFEEKNGKLYLNGTEIKTNVIQIKPLVKTMIFVSYLAGLGSMAALLNWIS